MYIKNENKKIMKLLGSSNYNNRNVINFLKGEFSKIETLKSSFITSEFDLDMDKLQVNFDGFNYRVTFWGLRMKDPNHYLCEKCKSNVHKDFNNRVDAIKFILFNLGIIRKSELN